MNRIDEIGSGVGRISASIRMAWCIVGEGIHGGIYIHNDIIFGIDELLKYRVDRIEAVTRDDRATW